MGLKTLNKLQEFIKQESIVSKTDLEVKFKDVKNMNYHLKQLQELGLTQSLRGFYTFDTFPDPNKLITKIKGKNILGYHSALEAHGLAQSNFYTVYVISKANRPDIYLGNYTIKFVKSRISKIQKMNVLNNSFNVTKIEQTLLDGLNKLQYMGGFEEFYRSFSGLNPQTLSKSKILKYLAEYKLEKLYNLVGFVYVNLSSEWNTQADTKFVKELRNKLREKPVKLEQSPSGKYIHDKTWNIMYPIELQQLFNNQ